MTLNGVIALILRFFSPNSIALHPCYVTVVEDIPIMSVKYCLLVPVFHFWPKLTHPAARSLCDSWTTCCYIVIVNDRNTNGDKSETILQAAGHWCPPAIIRHLQQFFAHLVTIHISLTVSSPQASPQLNFFDVTKLANKLLGDFQFTSCRSCYGSVNNANNTQDNVDIIARVRPVHQLDVEQRRAARTMSTESACSPHTVIAAYYCTALEGCVDLGTAVKVCSPCPRLSIGV